MLQVAVLITSGRGPRADTVLRFLRFVRTATKRPNPNPSYLSTTLSVGGISVYNGHAPFLCNQYFPAMNTVVSIESMFYMYRL